MVPGLWWGIPFLRANQRHHAWWEELATPSQVLLALGCCWCWCSEGPGYWQPKPDSWGPKPSNEKKVAGFKKQNQQKISAISGKLTDLKVLRNKVENSPPSDSMKNGYLSELDARSLRAQPTSWNLNLWIWPGMMIPASLRMRVSRRSTKVPLTKLSAS